VQKAAKKRKMLKIKRKQKKKKVIELGNHTSRNTIF
jgi:hypothetical protein